MDAEMLTTITSLVGSLGFPIVCAGALFYMLNKETKSHKEESDKWAEAVSKNSEAINNNTTVMQTFIAAVQNWHEKNS